MTTIRATCADCGDVELPHTKVRLLLRRFSKEGHIEFACPQCGRQRRRWIDGQTVTLLSSVGCSNKVARHARPSKAKNILAGCPNCSYEQSMVPADVLVDINSDRYYYRCLHCGKQVECESEYSIIGLLLQAGCKVKRAA